MNEHEYDYEQCNETNDADEKLTYTLGGIAANIFSIVLMTCVIAIMLVATTKIIQWIWFL